MKKSTKYLKIFCNLLAAVILLFGVFYILPKVLIYFMPFVVGLILALIANPVIKFLEKRIKIKRKYGSVLLIVLVIAGIVLICNGVWSLLWNGLKSFSEYLPTMYSNAGAELLKAGESLENVINRLPFAIDINFAQFEETLQEFFGSIMSGSGEITANVIGGAAKGIPGVLVSAVIGLLATYFFIVDREKITKLAEKKVSEELRRDAVKLYRQILGVVIGYFKAQFKIMGVIYIVLLIGLIVLGVDYAWLIAFGIAILDMLPVFGTGTVLCPWAAVKLFSGNYMMALGMLALYGVTLIMHQLIQPKLIGESMGMEPFAALFFMYIGYRVSSVAGMVIAIPVGMILINMYKAGTFDTVIWCVKEIVTDFNEFRRIKMKSEDER